MTMVFVEGFEWLGSSISETDAETYLTKFWFEADLDASTPIATSRGSSVGAYMDLTSHNLLTRKIQAPDGDTTCIVGFYWKTPTTWFNGGDFLRIICGGNIQCYFEIQSGGTMDFRRGGTSLGVSTYALANDNEYYIEVKVVVGDGTSGSMEMKIADLTAAADPDADTATEWTISGVDTRNSTENGETAWDAVQFLMAPSTAGYGILDDIYICNGADTDNFRGNSYVETIEPTGAGNSTQLTPSAGSNWQNVDDSTNPDDDTTYNTADADGETDLYECSNPAKTNGPEAVQIQAIVRTTSSDRRTIRLPIRNSATTNEGDDIVVLANDYRGRSRILETDATGAAWTNSTINAVEIGIKRQANS